MFNRLFIVTDFVAMAMLIAVAVSYVLLLAYLGP
jgi:hypothetical protein